ncbi:MAG: AtpZ/AtpI family protein [Armatimonadia bacterium]
MKYFTYTEKLFPIYLLTPPLHRCIIPPIMSEEDGRKSAARTGSALRVVAVLSGAGFTMAAAIAIGALGGRWLDQQFGTAPWLLIIGFLLGTVAGFAQMARIIAVAGKK